MYLNIKYIILNNFRKSGSFGLVGQQIKLGRPYMKNEVLIEDLVLTAKKKKNGFPISLVKVLTIFSLRSETSESDG